VNIIILGAPGSGKGTQSAILAAKLNIPAVSTGTILRQQVEKQSDIGNYAKSYVDSGKLVPDEVMINIIKSRIAQQDCQQGFILDGFPRNKNQAVFLDKMLLCLRKKIDIVFNFEAEDEILIKRISGRFSCKDCGMVYNHYFKHSAKEGICDKCGSNNFETRSDDNEATVRNRLKVYRKSTFELIEFYKKKNLLLSIEAVKRPSLIFEELTEATSKLFKTNIKI
jgi:adenylate kinase